MAKTIVILGANYAGVPLAHYLLKHTTQKVKDLKVIIVSPNTHMYWHIASVRAIVPDLLSDDQVFLPIAPTLAKYPSKSYEIVLGKAERLDPASNTVEVVTNQGASRTIHYDSLVIATGSYFRENMPFKILSSTEETKDRLHEFTKQIASASSVVVAGAGITGVELAAELGAQYGTKKQVILISDKNLPLAEKFKTDMRDTARRELEKFHVKIIPNAKVSGLTKTAGGAKTTLELSKTDGTKQTLEADVFIPTYGIVPNTQFVPADLLDARGFVRQTNTLQVEGLDNVFVVGDAGNLQEPQGKPTDDQVVHLVKVLDAYFAGAAALPEYQPSSSLMVGISLGKTKGTGQIGSWKAWSWLIAMLKSKHLGVDYAPSFVAGSRTIAVKSWA